MPLLYKKQNTFQLLDVLYSLNDTYYGTISIQQTF